MLGWLRKKSSYGDDFLHAIMRGEWIAEIIRPNLLNERERVLFRCIEGDLINYHAPFCFNTPFLFTMHLVKSMVYRRHYTLETRNPISGFNSMIGGVVTTEYLYADNIAPVQEILEEKNIGTSRLYLTNRRSPSIFRFAKTNTIIPIFSILKGLDSGKSLRLLLILLYVKYILLVDCEEAIIELKQKLDPRMPLIVSADPCDYTSRCIAVVCRDMGIEFILLQSGPTNSDNPEWKTCVCDHLIAWPSSKDFYHNLGITPIFFPPPRFYDYLKADTEKKYQLVVFLPWLSELGDQPKLLKDIEWTMTCLLEENGLDVYVRHHPARPIDNIPTLQHFKVIPDEEKASKIISESHMILNFGSTVNFDAEHANVRSGLVNTSNRLSKADEFFTLNCVVEIRDREHLHKFIEASNPERSAVNGLHYGFITWLLHKIRERNEFTSG